MDINEVTDELYGLDPGDFVKVRDAHVKEARAQGDRGLAKEISQLRKPTLVAWMVNILAREHSDDVEKLLELGEALRDAQRHLAGDDLRSLTTQRQKVVRAMARQAGEVAVDHGHSASENALREVGQSLHAALADPDIAEQVRAGRLVTAVSYSGMGPAGMAVVGGRARKPKAAPAEKKKPDPEEITAAKEHVAAAEKSEREADAALETAQADAEHAADSVAALDNESTNSGSSSRRQNRKASLRTGLISRHRSGRGSAEGSDLSARGVQNARRDLEALEH